MNSTPWQTTTTQKSAFPTKIHFLVRELPPMPRNLSRLPGNPATIVANHLQEHLLSTASRLKRKPQSSPKKTSYRPKLGKNEATDYSISPGICSISIRRRTRPKTRSSRVSHLRKTLTATEPPFSLLKRTNQTSSLSWKRKRFQTPTRTL